jgi:hypothetical protein
VPSASWTLTDALGVAANLATIAALLYAAYQVRQARITSSSTAAATIFSNIKRGIDEVASQTEEDGLYEATCGLLNEIEISCAIYLDGQFGGNTGKIATSFIKDILASIEKNETRSTASEDFARSTKRTGSRLGRLPSRADAPSR